MRDPRVQHSDNDEYIDMVENYFEKVSKVYYETGELPDSRPELSW